MVLFNHHSFILACNTGYSHSRASRKGTVNPSFKPRCALRSYISWRWPLVQALLDSFPSLPVQHPLRRKLLAPSSSKSPVFRYVTYLPRCRCRRPLPTMVAPPSPAPTRPPAARLVDRRRGASGPTGRQSARGAGGVTRVARGPPAELPDAGTMLRPGWRTEPNAR